MTKLTFLTSNDHKFNELNDKLSNINISLQRKVATYTEIQAPRIIDVARASLTQLIPLIDGNFLIEDAGLKIKTLNGFPGPYSSYVYSTLACSGILDLMKEKKQRDASFISVIGLYFENEIYFFKGVCNGKISFKMTGDKGFGFDPIFVPNEYKKTFSELNMDEKNKISHRGQSIDKLKEFLKEKL